MSGIERSNYIESNGPKKFPGIRNREDPVFRVFYYIKNRREKFGTDEIVRFHGESGIERIRFRGFLACRSRQASIVLERYFRFEMSLLSILCPNGDGNQSSFGRFRYYYVNYRTFARR